MEAWRATVVLLLNGALFWSNNNEGDGCAVLALLLLVVGKDPCREGTNARVCSVRVVLVVEKKQARNKSRGAERKERPPPPPSPPQERRRRAPDHVDER